MIFQTEGASIAHFHFNDIYCFSEFIMLSLISTFRTEDQARWTPKHLLKETSQRERAVIRKDCSAGGLTSQRWRRNQESLAKL